MKRIDEVLEGVTTVAIAGHVHPDGDCIGSCMAMYGYIRENYPQIRTDVYLEEIRPVFGELSYLGEVLHAEKDEQYDLLILFDVSSTDRIGVAGGLLRRTARTVCVDHHITNKGLAEINHVEPDSSSTCEVLFGLMDREKISRATAIALYTGIIHDSGVFQYSNTSGNTMRVAGWLMDQGIPHTRIIEESFYMKNYNENRILGHILENNQLLLGGSCIVGVVTRADMEAYHVTTKELGSIVTQLRLTRGVEAAVFLYETEPDTFKVSLRSNGTVDVSEISLLFGGGGHKMAAGFTLKEKPEKIIEKTSAEIEKQLQAGRE